MKKYAILITLLLPLAKFGWTQTIGFAQEERIKVSGVTSEGMIGGLGIAQKQTTRYFADGFGRTIQVVGLKAGVNGLRDVIQPIDYDTLGRQTKSYLPYAASDSSGLYRSGAIGAQASYYNATTDKVAHDSSAYSQRLFDNSPLQRTLRSGDFGKGFQPLAGQHFKAISYRPNTAADSVAVTLPDGSFSGYYGANALSVAEGTDEDGGQTLNFADLLGRTVMKREKAPGGANNDTYYLYNAGGMISYVVPPKAWKMIKLNGYTVATPAVSAMVFKYVYDYRGRVTEKTIPGAGVLYEVYDPLNRPVLIQDANLRGKHQWNYIKYDVKGRAVSQGIYTDNTHTTLAGMQAYVAGLNYGSAWYESRAGTPTGNGYYTNSIFPTSNTEPLAYSYFDDYDLNGDGTADYSYAGQGLPGEGSAAKVVRGLPTVVTKRSIGSGLGNIWLAAVTFYDKRGNTIQVQSNNQLNYTAMTAVTDIMTSVPDFTGKPTATKATKVTGAGAGNANTILTTLTYDAHGARLRYVDQRYNMQGAVRIAMYEYNELGQLMRRNLGRLDTAGIPAAATLGTANSVTTGNTRNTAASNRIGIIPAFHADNGATFTARIRTNYLQGLDYSYNIRGQLLTINNSKLDTAGGDPNDLFGMQVLYNEYDANLSNSPSYSGRISAVKWMSRDNDGFKTNERAYSYSYDLLNRLTAAVYGERKPASSGGFTVNAGGFNEDNIAYDDNGNILRLRRNSSTLNAASFTKVDSLTYTYDPNNPNRLQKVTDGAGSNYISYGFRNLTGSTGNYGYDGNGNLTADPFKGLAITYNAINRTDTIRITTATKRYLVYTYDAGGANIRKQQYDNDTLRTTTDYIAGFVYVNATLSYAAMPEGRVVSRSGTLTPEYVIADQQGNARVSFADNGSGRAVTVQENSYYAFGLTFQTSPAALSASPNKNLYNGRSEWQNDFSNLPDYYQTFFRNYDAAIGRFTGVDPGAESAESLTVYQYAGNNPVLFNDPLGDVFKNQATPMSLDEFLNEVSNSQFGGSWSSENGGSGSIYGTQDEAVGDNPRGDVFSVDDSGHIRNTGAKAFGARDVLTAHDQRTFVTAGVLGNFTSATTRSNMQYNYLTLYDQREAYGLFEFLANNTRVEWLLISSARVNYIATDHRAGAARGGLYLARDLLNSYRKTHNDNRMQLAIIHNHPVGDLHTDYLYPDSRGVMVGAHSLTGPFRGPSGYFDIDQHSFDGTGDLSVARWFNKSFPQNSIIFGVYEVADKTYYYYDDKKILGTSSVEK